MKRKVAAIFTASLLAICLLLSGCVDRLPFFKHSNDPKPVQNGGENPIQNESEAPIQTGGETPATIGDGDAQPSAPPLPSGGSDMEAEPSKDPEFTVKYYENILAGYDGFVEYVADETDSSIQILIAPDVAVKNFKFLKLDFVDYDDNTGIKFDVEELFSVEELLPNKPFLVTMTMFGTIPGYGVSYVDMEGVERRFSIAESGLDASISLLEFN